MNNHVGRKPGDRCFPHEAGPFVALTCCAIMFPTLPSQARQRNDENGGIYDNRRIRVSALHQTVGQPCPFPHRKLCGKTTLAWDGFTSVRSGGLDRGLRAGRVSIERFRMIFQIRWEGIDGSDDPPLSPTPGQLSTPGCHRGVPSFRSFILEIPEMWTRNLQSRVRKPTPRVGLRWERPLRLPRLHEITLYIFVIIRHEDWKRDEVFAIFDPVACNASFGFRRYH